MRACCSAVGGWGVGVSECVRERVGGMEGGERRKRKSRGFVD